jgi:hypothetical protein
MFCLMANSWMRFCASGLSVATSLRSLPSSCSVSEQIGLAVDGDRAPCRASASRKRMTRRSPSRADAAVADVLVAQQAAQVGRGRVEPLGQRALHVDLQQEVHAAAQVEAEVHRQRMHRGQPGGEADSRFSATT